MTKIEKAKHDLWMAYADAMKVDLDYVKAQISEWDIGKLMALGDPKEVELLVDHLKLLRAGLTALDGVEGRRGEPDHAEGAYKEFRRRIHLEFPRYGSED